MDITQNRKICPNSAITPLKRRDTWVYEQALSWSEYVVFVEATADCVLTQNIII